MVAHIVLCLWLLVPIRLEAGNSDSARMLMRQAVDAAVQHDYRRSSALLFRARSEAEKSADYEQLFWVYTNLGINQAELLNYADALQHFSKAYQIAIDHLDNRKVLSIRNNIAGLYMMNHENAKALAEYMGIYNDVKGKKDSVFIGGCALNIATLQLSEGKYAKALPYIVEAERMLGHNIENKATLTELRVDYLLGIHQPSIAYNLVQQVMVKYNALAPLPEMQLLHARTAQAIGRVDEAVVAGQGVLRARNVNLSMKREVFTLLSALYTQQGNYPKALACKDSVVWATDSLASVTGQKLFEARQIQFDIWQKQQEIDNYQSRHRLELALTLTAIVACCILVWALWVQKRNNRQQHRLSALELEREQERREALQARLTAEQVAMEAEQAASHRTIEQRSRELMSKALQAANRSDALRELLHALDDNVVLHQVDDPVLKRTIANLRHQLDSSVEWKDFTTYFEQANAAFIQSLKRNHTTLTANEIRYLSLVYINLSPKEIALLLNITPESCKKKKQQVARKMGLTDPKMLYDYLVNGLNQ
ncbi:MAG: hypothetical protein SPF85_10200 [Alloprevotella sp.]|nr:hypothetical protein [Alloprevotella sp.]